MSGLSGQPLTSGLGTFFLFRVLLCVSPQVHIRRSSLPGKHIRPLHVQCRCTNVDFHPTNSRVVLTLGIINGGLGLKLTGDNPKGEIAYGVIAGILWLLVRRPTIPPFPPTHKID